jgi:thiol-disulfide isomerase/thioredoxin
VGKNTARAEATRKAAEMRAAAARKERQQKQLITAAVAVVVVIIAAVIGLAIASQPDKAPASANSAADTAVTKLGSIPASAFDTAGKPSASSNSIPQKLEGGTVLKNGDKPEVVYVGAEYCPYCATERWSLVAALERFGNFSGLTTTRSADNDGNIPTVSFKDAKYTSDYISFRPVETQDRNGQPLEQIPADIEPLFKKYDAPPFVDAQSQGSIPWTFYGTHQTVGSGVPIQNFVSLSDNNAWTTIVEQMLTGKGDLGQPIMANANAITAQICTLTGNKPSDVCSSSAVVQTSPMLKP